MTFSTLVTEYYCTCWMMMMCVQDGERIKDIENRNKELTTLKMNKKRYRSHDEEGNNNGVTIPLTIIPSPFYMSELQQQQQQKKQRFVLQDDEAVLVCFSIMSICSHDIFSVFQTEKDLLFCTVWW